VAGTLFALLMGLANLGTALSTALGGGWYDTWTARWGHGWAFNVLVGVGALFTSACWLVVPLLKLPDSAAEPERIISG
jgi:MFS family permease